MTSSKPLPLDDTQLQPDRLWPREMIVGLLPIVIGVQVLVAATVLLPFALRGFADFRQLYAGGYMIRTGHAAQLYDYDTQQHFVETLVPVGQPYPLPINHLAFEELLFVPLSFLPYRTAYLFFMCFNGMLLVLCGNILSSSLGAGRSWLAFFLIPGFYPVVRALTEGQDSIILLALLVAAHWAIHRESEFLAGFFTGLGIFKFQLVLPIGLLFIVWRKWRFCAGFALSAASALLVSLWLVGLSGAQQYVQMLVSMSVHLHTNADILLYGTDPAAMLNLRGLASGIFVGRMAPGHIQLLVFALSAAVVFISARQRASLPLAVTTAVLVSYHCFAHDASVLIVPVATALFAARLWTAVAATIFFITSISALAFAHGYLSAIPLLALYIAMLLHPVRPRETHARVVDAPGYRSALEKEAVCQ